MDEHKIKFCDLNERGIESNIKMIKQADIARCPFFILMPSHYRPDGSCMCSNKEHRAMMIKEWGYKKSHFKHVKLED